MKFLILFLLTFHSFAGEGAPITQNCEQIVEEMDDSALLVALLVKMHEERVISKEDLERFYVSLMEGKLINPVPHEKGPYGPVITSGKELIFYKAFQNLVEFSNKIEYQAVAQQLKKIHQNLEQIKVEKAVISNETNRDFKLNAFIYESDLYALTNFSRIILEETDISKNYRYGLGVLKDYLLVANEEVINIQGFRIRYGLNPDEVFDVMMEKARTNPAFLSKLIPGNIDLILQSKRENLEKFAMELIHMPIGNNFILQILNKIGSKANDQLIEEVKNIIFTSIDQKNFGYLFEYLDFFKKYFPNQFEGLVQEVKKRCLAHNESKAVILRIQYSIDQNYEDFEKGLRSSDYILEEMFFGQEYLRPYIPRKDLVKIFKLALENPEKTIRERAITALGYFRSEHPNDKETLPLVRLIWSDPFHEKTRALDKIRTLTGVDESWAHEIIKKIHKSSFSGTDLYQKSAAALAGQKSRKSRDVIDEVFGHYGQFGTYADPKVAADFLKGRSKEDLYHFVEKYKFKNINFYGGSIERLFFDFNEKNINYKKMALMAIKDRNVSSDFAKKYLASLPKNESIQFLHEWIKSEMSHPGPIYHVNSLPGYLLSRMDYSHEAYAYADWQVRNTYDPANRALDLYFSLFFQAYDKLASKNPAEVDLAKKIINEFDLKLIFK